MSCVAAKGQSAPNSFVSFHAARIAHRELINWLLVSDYKWDEYEVYFFLTQAGRVRLGNMVDPKYTLGASIFEIVLMIA